MHARCPCYSQHRTSACTAVSVVKGHNQTRCGPANSPLFDHLVGAAEQRQGHGKTECFRGLEVDNQLDFRGLLHRQIGRFLAFDTRPV